MNILQGEFTFQRSSLIIIKKINGNSFASRGRCFYKGSSLLEGRQILSGLSDFPWKCISSFKIVSLAISLNDLIVLFRYRHIKWDSTGACHMPPILWHPQLLKAWLTVGGALLLFRWQPVR